MYILHANLGLVQRVNLEGVEYFSAPVIGVTAPSVVNGSFLGADEIASSVELWQDIPLVISHPTDENGQHISVHGVGEAQIGKLSDVLFENGKMRATAYLDIAKTALYEDGIRVLASLLDESPIDVSTAYFAELHEEPGEFDGVPFTHITRNIAPDHLAILPNAIGACSWEDGCGIPRVNIQESEQTDTLDRSSPMREKIIGMLLVNCDCSQEDLDAKSDEELLEMLKGPAKEESEDTEDDVVVNSDDVTPLIFAPPVQVETPELLTFMEEVITQIGGKEAFTEAIQQAQLVAQSKRSSAEASAISRFGFTQEDIKGLPLSVLAKLEAGSSVSPVAPIANYSAAAPFVDQNEAGDWEPYADSTVN